MKIFYIDRKSGEKKEEKIYGLKALSFIYGESFLAFIFLTFFPKIPLLSQFYGFLQKRASSAKKIEPFIQAYEVDRSEFKQGSFRSFNDFFIRELKPETRPIVQDPKALAAPADGRYFVYPSFDQFFVKGQKFCIDTFLQNQALANRYRDGSMVVARLCPFDYHRFHFPCDGMALAPRPIQGPLFSVNPHALLKRASILSENKRVITEIETECFGVIQFVEIGATFVGSIRQTFVPQTRVKKGAEKGYFEFGGSCIILLFEKGKVAFDADLIQNTQMGLETLLRYGESIGNCL